jgi:hypothetical protein
MNKILPLAIAGALSLFAGVAAADDEPGLFIYRDGLRARDSWGKLHQMPEVSEPDFAHRYAVRFHYYFKGRRTLEQDVAYVAAVQRDLKRLGYYCGPVDGVYTDDVSLAIAKLQKNYGLQVTGTLNVAVRRALHLP